MRKASVAVALTALLVVPTSASAGSSASWSTPEPFYAPSGRQMYAYAPSVIADGAQTYVYTCHNKVNGQIDDHVFFTRIGGEDHDVVRPGSGWDSQHICDPTVVAANVSYGGTAYRYVMFFLGTDLPNTRNQIGVAFANALGGPWVKYPEPIVRTPFSDPQAWGAGQPSATTINPNTGEIMLFYTEGGDGRTQAYYRHLTLGNMSNPVVGQKVPITNDGLTDRALHNFDVAYDPPNDRFVAIREAGPQPVGHPDYISERVEVVALRGGDMWAGKGTWTSIGAIGQAQTGYPRNHNAGLVRTVYGTLPSSNSVTAVYTVGLVGPHPASLYTYELWKATTPI